MATVTASTTPTTTPTNGPKPKPLMVSVKTFEGKEGKRLLLWTREPEMAMGSALLKTEQQRVVLAISKLGGRAREWAPTCGTSVETSFPTWEQLKQQLSRKELVDYVQELRTLIAGTAPGPLSEAVTVTVFMEGLRTGVARTEVFRTHPTSFKEDVNVALNAEFNFKSSRLGWNASYANPSSGPEPMDLSYVEDEEVELLAAEQRWPPGEVNCVTSEAAPHDSEQLYALANGVTEDVDGDVSLGAVPTLAALLELDEMSFDEFSEALNAGEVAEVAEVVVIRPEEKLNSSSLLDEAVLEGAKKALNARSGSEILKNPSDLFYPVIREYRDVVSKEPPFGLPFDRGAHHEIDLVPGTKYCVTRQWSLPREQCDVIDAFFCAKYEAGLVRESKSPQSPPAFCIRKPNGKWRIGHAFNKLNAASIPAQTLIPRKDVLQNNMVGCTLYTDLDLVDGGIRSIVEWPVPRNQKDLRKWLVFANYLHKYSENYAETPRPLSNLLKKDAEWRWSAEHQDAFEAIKESLLYAPILALPDSDRPFSVVCDTTDFAIGCALLQADAAGRERMIQFESRQLKAAEKNYPVHDKEPLAMKYSLGKFEFGLLGSNPSVIYTYHASLRTATQSLFTSRNGCPDGYPSLQSIISR
ncbi:unnamed protein product [Phytophthora fragariaefolia]|uniref:Unnamed protein product n=1 Tax=Phytophthora fragariaefolia TaxID=1490495 RepID=A0A9W6TS95_9STRA|nr:unnamed protein product [Phytophthora fragariaefolia]